MEAPYAYRGVRLPIWTSSEEATRGTFRLSESAGARQTLQEMSREYLAGYVDGARTKYLGGYESRIPTHCYSLGSYGEENLAALYLLGSPDLLALTDFARFYRVVAGAPSLPQPQVPIDMHKVAELLHSPGKET